jgi:hypothetical protein
MKRWVQEKISKIEEPLTKVTKERGRFKLMQLEMKGRK